MFSRLNQSTHKAVKRPTYEGQIKDNDQFMQSAAPAVEIATGTITEEVVELEQFEMSYFERDCEDKLDEGEDEDEFFYHAETQHLFGN